MIKKVVMMALAVGALVAFAVPAAASASEWTKGGNPLTEEANGEFTGRAKFDGGLASYECTVHAPVTLIPGSTGTVNKFEITTEGCVGTGLLAGCTLTAHETTGAPWTMHVNATATQIVITGVIIHNTFNSGCSIPSLTLTLPNVVATPDNTGAISSVELSGSGTTDALGLELPTTVSGTLEAKPAGVYGIQ